MWINDFVDLWKIIKSNLSKFEWNNFFIYLFSCIISFYLTSLYLDYQNNQLFFLKNVFLLFLLLIIVYLFISFFIHIFRLFLYKWKKILYISSNNYSIENNIKTILSEESKNSKISLSWFISYWKLFYISNITDAEYYYSRYNLNFIIYIDDQKNIFYKYRWSWFYFKILLEWNNVNIEYKILILTLLKLIEDNNDKIWYYIKIIKKYFWESTKISKKLVNYVINKDITNEGIKVVFDNIIKSDKENYIHYNILKNYCISKTFNNSIWLKEIYFKKLFSNNTPIFPEYDLILEKLIWNIFSDNFNFLQLENYFLVIYRWYLYNLLLINNKSYFNNEDIYNNIFFMIESLFSNSFISEDNKYYIIFHYYLYWVISKYSLDKEKFIIFLDKKWLNKDIIEKYFIETLLGNIYTIERVFVYSYIFNNNIFLENFKILTKKIHKDYNKKDFDFYLNLKI